MVLNVLIKNKNPNICGTGGQRVKGEFTPLEVVGRYKPIKRVDSKGL